MTPATAPGLDEATAAIVGRVSGRLEEIVRGMVERYREEVVDYRLLDEEILYTDVYEVSLDNFRSLLENLEHGEILRPEQLEASREAAARRVHQDVSLESFLHAFRLWGQDVWETMLQVASPERPEEREAALRIAGRVFQHIDMVSTAAAQAYLDEAQGVWSDREVLRRDLLDALLSGSADAEAVRLPASQLRLDLRDDYVVVILRGGVGQPPDEAERRPLPERAALRDAVETAKVHLRPESGSLLVGVRRGEVVALYPLAGPAGVRRVREQCTALLRAIGRSGLAVGLGSWHHGLRGVASSYAEAREAVEAAARSSARPPLVSFDEILLDHMLRTTPHSDRVLADTLGPLERYDAARKAELVPTLRAYFEAGFNVTRSAATLHVHPNTVVYRLRRIKELTGRDPHNPDDLLLLSLGLRLARGAPAAQSSDQPA